MDDLFTIDLTQAIDELCADGLGSGCNPESGKCGLVSTVNAMAHLDLEMAIQELSRE